MAILDEMDPLQKVFDSWVLNRRRIVWLWTQLQGFRDGALVGDLDTPDIYNKMADFVTRKDLKGYFNKKYQAFFQDSAVDWIERTGRQPMWLLDRASRHIGIKVTFPARSSSKEKLLLLLDLWDRDQFTKQEYLAQLKVEWVKQQLNDKKLSWYSSAGKEKQKCKIAWEWYQKQHANTGTVAYTPEFSKVDDVFSFLDQNRFSDEEKLYHLEQIKKRFKTEEIKASRQNKKQTNLSLSDESRSQLNELAKRSRMTKTQLIEHLILSAVKYGIPK